MKCAECMKSKYFYAVCGKCGNIPAVICAVINVPANAFIEHDECYLLNKEA
jgi:hypothetical protein